MPIKIKYLGPSPSVNVGGFGEHAKGQGKEYPDDVAEELLRTGKKQKFEACGTSDTENNKKGQKADSKKEEKAEAE